MQEKSQPHDPAIAYAVGDSTQSYDGNAEADQVTTGNGAKFALGEAELVAPVAKNGTATEKPTPAVRIARNPAQKRVLLVVLLIG